jgi:hypothetical protein
MAFEMGSVPKDPIDVRHFSLSYQFQPFNIFIFYYTFTFVQKREIYFNQDLIAENRRLKEALVACQGILELRDAALAVAEAMGLSYEVLGFFSAGLTLLLAIIRAIWVHYRGTPFVVDRIGQLSTFNSIYFSNFYITIYLGDRIIHALFH